MDVQLEGEDLIDPRQQRRRTLARSHASATGAGGNAQGGAGNADGDAFDGGCNCLLASRSTSAGASLAALALIAAATIARRRTVAAAGCGCRGYSVGFFFLPARGATKV